MEGLLDKNGSIIKGFNKKKKEKKKRITKRGS